MYHIRISDRSSAASRRRPILRYEINAHALSPRRHVYNII